MWLTLSDTPHQLSIKNKPEEVKLRQVKNKPEEIKLRQVTVIGSDTRKFDMSINSFQITPFCIRIFLKLWPVTNSKTTKYLSNCLIQKIYLSNMSVQVTPFCRPIFRSFHIKQGKNEQVPVKKAILTVYTRWVDSLMTSKNATFGLDENRLKPVSMQILTFSQNE